MKEESVGLDVSQILDFTKISDETSD